MATRRKIGKFEKADGITIFLDEIVAKILSIAVTLVALLATVFLLTLALVFLLGFLAGLALSSLSNPFAIFSVCLVSDLRTCNRSRVLGSGLLFFVNDPMQPGQSGLA